MVSILNCRKHNLYCYETQKLNDDVSLHDIYILYPGRIIFYATIKFILRVHRQLFTIVFVTSFQR